MNKVIRSLFEEIVRAYPHVIKEMKKQREKTNDLTKKQRSLMSEEEAEEYDYYLFLVSVVDMMERFIEEGSPRYGTGTL